MSSQSSSQDEGDPMDISDHSGQDPEEEEGEEVDNGDLMDQSDDTSNYHNAQSTSSLSNTPTVPMDLDSPILQRRSLSLTGGLALLQPKLMKPPPTKKAQPAKSFTDNLHISQKVTCRDCSRKPANSRHGFQVVIWSPSAGPSSLGARTLDEQVDERSKRRRSSRLSGSVGQEVRALESFNPQWHSEAKTRMESVHEKTPVQKTKNGSPEKRVPATSSSNTIKVGKRTIGVTNSKVATTPSIRTAANPSKEGLMIYSKELTKSILETRAQTMGNVKTLTENNSKRQSARVHEYLVKSDPNPNTHKTVRRKPVLRHQPGMGAANEIKSPKMTGGKATVNKFRTILRLPPGRLDIPTPYQPPQRPTPPRIGRKKSSNKLVETPDADDEANGGESDASSRISTPTGTPKPKTIICAPPTLLVMPTPLQQPQGGTPPREHRKKSFRAEPRVEIYTSRESSASSSVSTPTAAPKQRRMMLRPPPIPPVSPTPVQPALRQTPPRRNHRRRSTRADVDATAQDAEGSSTGSSISTPTIAPANRFRETRTLRRAPLAAPVNSTPQQPNKTGTPPGRNRRRRSTRSEADADQSTSESSMQSGVSTPAVAPTNSTLQPRSRTGVWDSAMETWTERYYDMMGVEDELPSGHETLTEVDSNDEIEPDSWDGYE